MNFLSGVVLFCVLSLLLQPLQVFGIAPHQIGYGQRDEFPEEVLLILGGGLAAAAGFSAFAKRKSNNVPKPKRTSKPRVKVASGRVLADIARGSSRAGYVPTNFGEKLDSAATTTENWEEINVTAVAPKRVVVNEEFPVVVAIHNPKLQPELPNNDDGTLIKVQKPGWIYRDPKSPIVHYRVTVKANRCLVLYYKEYFFRLDTNHHTQEFEFKLKPLSEGQIRVTVTAEQVDPTYGREHRQGELIRQTYLELVAVLSAVESEVIEEANADVIKSELYNSDRFDLKALRAICDEMKIDWENLEGDTREDKARELFLHCQRRGQLDELARAMNNI